MKEINYNKLDPEVAPVVRYFNSVGLRTRMSCSGHPGNLLMSMLWVEFADDVTEDDILKFMYQHADSYRIFSNSQNKMANFPVFICGGRFVNWLELGSERGMGIHSWNYMAANPETAMNDISKWKSMDEKRKIGENGGNLSG